jgi:hypothetical protein
MRRLRELTPEGTGDFNDPMDGGVDVPEIDEGNED